MIFEPGAVSPHPCVLVTRPQHQAPAFVAALKHAGLRTEEFPLIEIVPPQDTAPLEKSLSNISDYDMLLLTSINGVKVALDYLQRHNMQIPPHVHLVCVGPTTLKAIEDYGYTAIVPAQDYTAEGVVKMLRERDVARQKVLYPRAEMARDVIAPALRESGAQVDDPVAYRTVAASTEADRLLEMLKQKIDIVTFTSSSAVHNYVALLGERMAQVPDEVKYASIGPITSATAREYALPIHVEAHPYTIPGLVAALKSAI